MRLGKEWLSAYIICGLPIFKMKRRELRENIFKIVFSFREMNDFSDIFGDCFTYYKEINEISEADGDYIKNEVSGIIENLSEIDDLISKNIKNYTIDRLSGVCLAALRVGIYEMLYAEDIPESVAVSEALNLVSVYEDDKTKPFVNGVLGAVSRAKSDKTNEGNE